MSTKSERQATTELQAAIWQLPRVNRDAFESLILVCSHHQARPNVQSLIVSTPQHFQRVTDKASQNTMTSEKLAAALAPCFKGGVDSGAGPKLPLADLTWAFEHIIRRGDFWFRDAAEPPDVADDVEAAQPICTVCRKPSTLTESATEEGLRALPCGHVFHHDCIEAYLGKYHECANCKASVGFDWEGLKDGNGKETEM